jgi:hypothetical protein
MMYDSTARLIFSKDESFIYDKTSDNKYGISYQLYKYRQPVIETT